MYHSAAGIANDSEYFFDYSHLFFCKKANHAVYYLP